MFSPPYNEPSVSTQGVDPFATQSTMMHFYVSTEEMTDEGLKSRSDKPNTGSRKGPFAFFHSLQPLLAFLHAWKIEDGIFKLLQSATSPLDITISHTPNL